MSDRRITRTLAIILIVLAASAAALGGMLYGCFEEKAQLQQRTASLESALAVAQAGLSDEQKRFSQKAAEADALRNAAGRSEQLQSEIALIQQDLQSAQSELKRQTSLANANETRAGMLSVTNEELRETIAHLRARASKDEAEIEQLSALLTACEEDLAGTEALYKEAFLSLADARGRSNEDEACLQELSKRLTQVEEDYAGASALLAESDDEIARAHSMVLTYYNSAEAALLAADAKQAELDLLREQLAALQAGHVAEKQSAAVSSHKSASAVPNTLSEPRPIRRTGVECQPTLAP